VPCVIAAVWFVGVFMELARKMIARITGRPAPDAVSKIASDEPAGGDCVGGV
jgi:hypothetical protein